MDKNKIFLKLPKLLRENFFFLINNKNISDFLQKKREILQCIQNENIINWGCYNTDKKAWIKSFKQLTYKTKDGVLEAKYFFEDEIKKIKVDLNCKEKIILICLVKNDLVRMKKFISHYNNLGIRKYAIIDNDSTDGTFEFLKMQKNVDLFQVKEKYSTIRRQSWINRIISYYGYNKWYLILDSDEFIKYNDMTKHDIYDLISYYEKNKIKRARALLIDMYPESLMLGKKKNIDFINLFKYCDSDTYIKKQNKYFNNIVGGMRGRILKTEKQGLDFFLVKYPLIYFEHGMIQYNSHYSFPFHKNFKDDLNIALLHYKFLPNDLDKIIDIVKNKNFADGSKEYEGYLQLYNNNPEMVMTYDKSIEIKGDEDIYKIPLLSKINWND